MHLTAVLSPHVHMAWCGPDIVILDVRSDEYALLVDLADRLRPGLTSGSILVDPELLEDLRSLGLLGASDALDVRVPLPELTGEVPGAEGPISWLTVLPAILNSLVSTASFHRKSFQSLVTAASQRRSRDNRRDEAQVSKAAGAFQKMLPLIPFEGDCLQRGFMLQHHLHRAGVAARWVFGVRTWPFLAHCWVQVDSRVVGDTVERVRGFTPIMAV